MPRVLVLAALLLSFAALVPALGPVMHESDQASLLYGVVQLADRGASAWSADFYNYDKQFGSYWLLAGLHRALPAIDVVTLGNCTSFIIFWAGAGAVVAIWLRRNSMRPRNDRASTVAAAFVACLLAPAIWMHSPFLATAFLSGGFLLAGCAATFSGPGPWRRMVAVVLFIAAVVCRADAVLVLPWVCWMNMSARGVQRVMRSPWIWIVGAAATTALAVGRVIHVGPATDVHAPFFNPKLFAAFTVFGLGAAMVPVGWIPVALVRIALVRRHRTTTGFYALGAVFFLLPTFYYAFQFFSPRYWVPTLCAVLGVLATRRGKRLLALPNGHRAAVAVPLIMLGTAVLPVVVGLRLPFVDEPELVVTDATVFPTPDGHQPMGAMWAHLRRLARSANHISDHNQATWQAAQTASYATDATGRVPILDFSLRSYVQLATALRGQPSHIVTTGAADFYCDERDLLRVYHTAHRFSAADRFGIADRYGITPASPRIAGCGVVRARLGGTSDPAFLQRLAAARLAQGNELKPWDVNLQHAMRPEGSERGRTVIFHSAEPFVLQFAEKNGRTRTVASQTDPSASIHWLKIRGQEWRSISVSIVSGKPTASITVLPDYMSTDRL